MLFRILALLLLPVLCIAQVNSTGEKPTGELLSNEISPNEMKRNASFNLEEIKVRWKKAALENCPGVPFVTLLSQVLRRVLLLQQEMPRQVLHLLHRQVMGGVL